MAAKLQEVTIKIPKAYKKSERESIAQEVIDFIVDRTLNQKLDRRGNKFTPGYSKEYANSPEGKAGGKKKGATPNLWLSGDMLTDLDLKRSSPGEITIGYKSGTESNAKADGNIRGTYGKQRGSKSKSRDYLGIQKTDLTDILQEYPLEQTKKFEKTQELREEGLRGADLALALKSIRRERKSLIAEREPLLDKIINNVGVSRLDDEN